MKIALGAVLALVLLVVVIGALLPRQHTASRTLTLRRSPAEVYAVIRDFAATPAWRKDVKRVTLLDASRFREESSHGTVTYEVVEDVPGQRLVTRIVDQDLGYSGRWTYQLEPAPEGTLLRITEDGDVSNVVFRFLSRFVFGHATTMERYLAALATRLA
ncbi:MAG TPA: SRPBCC family protein [Thermoanaerobaculia bacterium]|nr:SRPBCC family protein [Thermoanaerobaculia bacterium]